MPGGTQTQTETQTQGAVAVSWKDKNKDPMCSASGGYHDPNTNSIVLCVSPKEQVKEFDRTKFRATLLHEYFHKVLGGVEVDVYSNAPLYPLLESLQAAMPTGAASKTKAAPTNTTLALRNPDSLVEFVFRAARVSSSEIDDAVPTAPDTPNAGDCHVDRAQLALGIAYQWLRWAEREDAENSGNPTRLERIRAIKTILSEAGKNESLTESTPSPKSPNSWSVIKPPKINIDTNGKGTNPVSVTVVGSTVNLTVTKAFFSEDLIARVRLILGSMGATSTEVQFMEKVANTEYKAEYDVLLAAIGVQGKC
jgi:hypothetical protein